MKTGANFSLSNLTWTSSCLWSLARTYAVVQFVFYRTVKQDGVTILAFIGFSITAATEALREAGAHSVADSGW